MKIQIQQHVRKGNQYAHYPGQILIDHPDEKALIDSGKAVAVKDEPENAKLTKPQQR